jgi:hypothetical protein
MVNGILQYTRIVVKFIPMPRFPEGPPPIYQELTLHNLGSLSLSAYADLMDHLARLGVRYTGVSDVVQREEPRPILAGRADFRSFAEERNYRRSLATQSWNAVGRQATYVMVTKHTAYRPPQLVLNPPLHMSVLAAKGQGLAAKDYMLDVESLADTLRIWLQDHEELHSSPPEGMDSAVLSFLADFANEHLRLEPPFPVTRSPWP